MEWDFMDFRPKIPTGIPSASPTLSLLLEVSVKVIYLSTIQLQRANSNPLFFVVHWIANGAVWVTPDFDTKFNSARAFTYVANIFGGIAFFTLWLASCCPISQSRLKCLSFHFFIATLFQGLTLLIFQSNVCKPGFFSVYFPPNIDTGNVTSEVSCSLSTGTNLAIVATAF
jgi:hypothetical protein